MSDEKTQTPTKLDEVIDTLVATLKDTKSFVIEQAPDVAKQMIAEKEVEIKYEAISNGIFLVGSVVVGIGSLLWPTSSDGATFVRGALGLCALVCIFPSVAFLLECLKQSAQLRVAPKVFLLQKLKKLVK